MSDPILPFPSYPEGAAPQAIEIIFNDGMLRAEALVRPCLGVANDEAGGDAQGDVWIVGSAPTGAFSTFDEDDVAIFDGAGWHAWAPTDELPLIVAGVRKIYSGSAWIDDPSIGGGGASRSPVIQSVTSSATVTPTFDDDMVKITAQAAGLTLANPTGTPIPGLGMVIRIKDNGTARSITFGSEYRGIGLSLPTTTVISKTLYIAMVYNSDDTKWDVLSVGQEA